MFVKVNYKGTWYTCQLDEEEIKQIKREALDSNIKASKTVYKYIKNNFADLKKNDEESYLKILSTNLTAMTQHWIYKADEYAQIKVASEAEAKLVQGNNKTENPPKEKSSVPNQTEQKKVTEDDDNY